MHLRRFARSRLRYTFSLNPVFVSPKIVEARPTNSRCVFLFADEILQRKFPLKETSLYRAAASGERVMRRIGPNGALRRLTSDADFELYLSRFLALTDSIARRGLLEIRRAPEVAPSPRERNIKVLAWSDGSIHHKSCGKHRLAIAKALDLPEIPVHLFFGSPIAWFRFHCKSDTRVWRSSLLSEGGQSKPRACNR